MALNKPTTDEHFIPQCYLKQFTEDGEHLYQYDVLSGNRIKNPVSTKGICYEKNLYEFKNDNGDYVVRNLIEKSFGKYEGEFANVFRSIRSKSKYSANFYTLSFLTLKEKAFLIFFLSTIIVRNPDVLQAAQEVIMEFFGEQISETSARNFALQTCLPIYKELDIEERNLLNPVMKFFEDMSFQIGITNNDVLLTSDNPVVLYGNNQPVKLDEVVMPISPRIALIMKPYADTKKERYNRLIMLSTEGVDYINSSIITHCKRWLYSKEQFTDEQIEWISEIRS